MPFPSQDRADFSLRRRELFQLSFSGLLFLKTACKTGEVLTRTGGDAAPQEGGLALDTGEYRTLVAVCDTLYPGTTLLPSALSLKLPRRVDEALYFAPPRTREQFALALKVLEYGGIFIGFWGRFSSLSLERRRKAFLKLLHHPLGIFRTVGVALKQVVQLYYYTHPATWKAISYEGPFMPEKPLPASQIYAQRLLERASTPSQE